MARKIPAEVVSINAENDVFEAVVQALRVWSSGDSMNEFVATEVQAKNLSIGYEDAFYVLVRASPYGSIDLCRRMNISNLVVSDHAG